MHNLPRIPGQPSRRPAGPTRSERFRRYKQHDVDEALANGFEFGYRTAKTKTDPDRPRKWMAALAKVDTADLLDLAADSWAMWEQELDDGGTEGGAR